MAEVGVLELTIRDNSEEAAAGLDKLTGTLEHLKNVVAGGMRLSGVAKQIEKIGNSINHCLSESTLSKINQLSDALQKIKSVGGSLGNYGKLSKMTSDFSEASGKVEELKEKIDNLKSAEGVKIPVMAVDDPHLSTIYRNEYGNQIKQMYTIQQVAQACGMSVDDVRQRLKELREETDTVTSSVQGAVSQTSSLSDTADNVSLSLQKLKSAGGGLSSQEKLEKMAVGFSAASEEVETLKNSVDAVKQSVGEGISIPVKTVVDPHLSTLYRNEHGYLIGNTKETVDMQKKYAPLPERTFDDYYNGDRWIRDEETGENIKFHTNDLTSQWLHGQGTETEQMYAIQQIAQACGMSVDEVRHRLSQLNETMQDFSSHTDEMKEETENASFSLQSLKESLGELERSSGHETGTEPIEAIQQVAQDCEMSVNDVRQKMDDLNGATQVFNSQTEEMRDKTERASYSLQDLKKRLGELKKTSGQGVFSKLLSQFERLLRFRVLRNLVRRITSGFSEGIENVYNYSKAISGTLAPSMDSAVSAFAQMRNSIGAAIAPAIQAIIPVLNSAVNWFITLINYANQFFALLGGQSTWTRTLTQSANAFDKQKKSAQGAGAAIKDLLADWDELNIIQSDSGSGVAAASAAEDYLKMFEEVGEFDNKIKKIADFIKNNIDDVWDIVKKIGVALLGWKVSTAFTGLISQLGSLVAAGAVIGITWQVTTLFDREYMKTGDTGWLVADALTNLVGATLAGGIISTVLGGAAGLITAGITLTVSAGISYGIAYANEAGDKADALKKLSGIKAAIGFAAMAAGFGIAAGSVGLGLLSAFVVAVPMFTLSAAVAIAIEQWHSATEIAKEAFSNTGKGGIKVEEVFKALQDELDKATEGYSLVIDAFSGSTELKTNLVEAFQTVTMLSATVRGDGKLTQKEADEFKKAWSTVFEAFEGLTSTSFDTVFAGLNKSLSSENAEIREQAKQLRISTLMMQENLSQAMAEFRLEQEDLADKIGKGTATSGEVEQYFRNLELIAKSSRSSITDLETILSGRKTIDFGDPESAAGNAVQFIKDAQEASAKALNEINEGYQSEMESLEILWKQTELAHDVGKITDSQYEMYKGLFETMRENFAKAAETEKSKVTSDVQGAYKAVLDQALSGIAGIPGIMDENGNLDILEVAAYLAEIMLPILEAAQDAGAEFSEEFGKMFGIGINIDDWIGQGWSQKLGDYIKQLITDNQENKPETPALDNTALEQSITAAKGSVSDMCNSIRASISSLSGLGFSFDTSAYGGTVTGKMKVAVPVQILKAATGGFIKSGDLIMANENGNIEMMGKMGNQPVIANNNQIVAGISQANNGVVNAINALGDYIVRELQKSNNKPVTVNLSPSSSWGSHNAKSQIAFDRVTG